MDHAWLAALVFAVTAALSAGLVPVARVLARRFGVLDAPGTRKVHAVPTPRLGGVAVFCSFGVVVLSGYLLVPTLSNVPWVSERLAATLAVLREAYRVEGKLIAVLAGASVAWCRSRTSRPSCGPRRS